MKRIPCLIIAIFFSLVSSLALAQVKPVTVRVGHNKAWANAALEIARHKKAFEKYGLNVTWHELPGIPQMIEGMIGGSLEMGVVAPTTYMIFKERGAKVTPVVLLQGANFPPIGWYMAADSGISAISDLKGKTLAVNNFAGNYDIYLRHILEKNGLDPKKDVAIVELPLPAIAGAITTGRIALGGMAPPMFMASEARSPGKLKRLFDFTDVDPKKGQENNSLVMAVRDDFIQRQRETIKSFLKAYLEVVKWVNANQKEALQAWAEASGNPALTKLPRTPDMPDHGKIYLESFQFDADLLFRYGYLKKKLKAEEVADMSLLEEIATGK